MVGFNPLAGPANILRQFGEQANSLLLGAQGQATQGVSGLLRSIASGAPPLPGLPAIAGNGGGNPNGNNNGVPGIPTPAGVAQLLRPLAQLESSILPRGVPGPAQTIMAASRGATQVSTEAGADAATEAAAAASPRGAHAGVEGLNGAGSRRAIGVQLS